MRLSYKISVPVIAAVVFAGWAFTRSSANLAPADYAAWVENPENGLLLEKELPTGMVTAICKPLDYVLLMEADAKTLSSNESMAARKAELGQMQYFELRIPAQLAKDDKTQQHLAGQLQNNITLAENGLELPCVLYHYEPAQGLRPFDVLLLGFEQSESTAGAKQLSIKSGVRGINDLTFSFSPKAFENIPNLTTL